MPRDRDPRRFTWLDQRDSGRSTASIARLYSVPQRTIQNEIALAKAEVDAHIEAQRLIPRPNLVLFFPINGFFPHSKCRHADVPIPRGSVMTSRYATDPAWTATRPSSDSRATILDPIRYQLPRKPEPVMRPPPADSDENEPCTYPITQAELGHYVQLETVCRRYGRDLAAAAPRSWPAWAGRTSSSPARCG